MSATPEPRSTRPNIVFIAIDDQNDWISPLGGHPLAHTPNFERLAARGVTFANHHCQAPLCTPSRTSLLTGMRPSTTGIYALDPSFRTIPKLAELVTLPQHFAAHGYATLTCGKVLHHTPQSEEGRVKEFQRWEFIRHPDPRPPEKLIPPTPAGNHKLMDWGVFPHADEDKRDYQTASWACDRLAELSAKPNEPFFLACGFAFPHVPCYINQRWLDLIPDDDRLLPPILQNDRDDTPRFSWYTHWDLPEPRTTWLEKHDQLRAHTRTYLAASAFMDAQLGRILDQLDALQLAENTIVVVWSDHGYHHGQKGITGKNSLWEESTRVPLFISGPQIPKGTRVNSPSEHLDIYPTLVELCGLSARSGLEGESLVPRLRDPTAPRERPAITTANPGNHAIRDNRWRYIRYADGSEELYDHTNDPREWQNLATDPAHADTLANLRRWLPAHDAPHVPASANRTLTYDATTDTANWENHLITRETPIP